MRIAMIAPPFGPLGGPEVVCAHLTKALVKKGADVTLYAPGDWTTSAKHIHTLPQSLWAMPDFSEQTLIERRNLIFSSQLRVLENSGDFDIIHTHSQRTAATLGLLCDTPCVVTLHNQIALRDLKQIDEAGIFSVAISDGRQKKQPSATTIQNGIPVEDITFSAKCGSYLLCIGRITEGKGIHLAIDIARASKKKLIIIGRVGNSPERQAYYQEKVVPFLGNDIEFKGEVPQEEIFQYLRGAEALVIPIQSNLSVVPLVVMEAFACGTPVITTPINGQTFPKNVGYFSFEKDRLIQAAIAAGTFNRQACRKYAEENFSSSRMADYYISLYTSILERVPRG